jgi:hypothetical protein
MQMHETTMQPRRGRPPTGIRKEVVQVPLDPEDAEILDKAATAMGRTKAELARALFKGEVTWDEVTKSARKAKR